MVLGKGDEDVKAMPLSNSIVSKRTDEMSKDSEIRLFEKLSKRKISVQLDELTLKDNGSLTTYVTYIDKGATETSKNITARVIERDNSGEIYYFLEDSRGFRTRKHDYQNPKTVAKLAANLVTKNDANLTLPPRFRQVLLESPL
ncbi:hypothetical protein TNCV_1459511 [Trichonephila clavipes]|nr:hypothetical protein TNCV_1459511 [Trichonephila clavipes]